MRVETQFAERATARVEKRRHRVHALLEAGLAEAIRHSAMGYVFAGKLAPWGRFQCEPGL
ncbi:hypothetical protein [Sphingomonas sp. LaA6.9]|uniref:hypothetical protein n=1 Tax=Sphingomonas sp. LaA6.9 TaxID=2919914 RepID=UPI001F504007|nr:hypothetical protein [Sphingomonas sp. LaA6.9]MCJ8158200.1 hypothetical protein [Sphingomonas sp. LaA6.9]